MTLPTNVKLGRIRSWARFQDAAANPLYTEAPKRTFKNEGHSAALLILAHWRQVAVRSVDPMALKHILTLALVLFSLGARADCAGEARKAREAILTSGPFQYKSRQWNKNFDRLQTGLIVPNEAEHILETAHSRHGRHWAGGETISIGKQSWEKDSVGWLPPHGTFCAGDLRGPDAPYEASSTKCLGSVEVEGQSLIGFEQNARMGNRDFIEKIFVEPGSGLPVRYERSASAGDSINVINTYRYDASIKIEAPKVDLAERKQKSLHLYEESVASADPKCRQEVIDTINRGQTAIPFQYEIAGGLWVGVAGMRGTFVPPDAVHNIVDGDPYHGGGRETLAINGQTWSRRIGEEWAPTSRKSPMAGAVSASWSGPLVFPGYLIGVTDFIGRALCLGEVETIRGRLNLYEYELYRDRGGERTRVIKRRMFADPARCLPLMFDDLDYEGAVARYEIRSYNKAITLTPPVIAPDHARRVVTPDVQPPHDQPRSGGLY